VHSTTEATLHRPGRLQMGDDRLSHSVRRWHRRSGVHYRPCLHVFRPQTRILDGVVLRQLQHRSRDEAPNVQKLYS
jgi:hypothetical protein